MRVQKVTPSYFGKVASANDFITSPGADHRLIRRLDRWLAECMARLVEHPGWQAAYDACGPFDVLAASSGNSNVAAASCLPSQDGAGRRFPLLGSARIRSHAAIPFTVTAPVAFGTLWSTLQENLAQLQTSQAADQALSKVAAPSVRVPIATTSIEHALHEYLSTETVSHLDKLLAAAGHDTQVTHVLAALHPLLRSVAARPDAPIHRGLVLPLPGDPLRRPRVAAFWMDQLVKSLCNRDIEVVALFASTPAPRLIISLDATRGTELTAAVHPPWASDAYVDLTMAPVPSRDKLPLHAPRSPHATLSRLNEAFLLDQREMLPCD